MVNGHPITDSEFLLRHIPGDPDHLGEGPRATSANFELRAGETGISVSREAITAPAHLMARLGNPATGSRIARAYVRDVRELGLVVVPSPIPEDAGHAEIQSGSANLGSRSIRRRLAKLFRLIDGT